MTSLSRRTYSATSCQISWLALWAGLAWHQEPISGMARRSSKPCTGPRPTSRAKGSPIRSMLLAAALMLDHVGSADLADRLRTAILQTLQDDQARTRDLGGTAPTKEFGAAIIRRLAN